MPDAIGKNGTVGEDGRCERLRVMGRGKKKLRVESEELRVGKRRNGRLESGRVFRGE